MAAILNKKKLHSFILTQLHDGSHLQFYHLGFSQYAKKHFTHSFWLNLMMAAILNSAILDSDTAILDSDTLLSSLRFTQNTLTPLWLWLKLIQSDSNSLAFSLNLMMAAILNSAILNLAILDSAILVFPLKLWLTLAKICSHYMDIKELHSFILTQLDDGSHLEFCHVWFRNCHLGFRYLVIFSHIHSKTLSLHSDSDWN